MLSVTLLVGHLFVGTCQRNHFARSTRRSKQSAAALLMRLAREKDNDKTETNNYLVLVYKEDFYNGKKLYPWWYGRHPTPSRKTLF